MTQGYVATWNGVASSSIDGLVLQRVRRGMFGGVRDTLVDVPGRDGAWLFEERRGNKIIDIEGVLVAGTPEARHAQVVEVADWLDLIGYRKLFISDQPDRYWLAALRTDPTPDEWRLLGRLQLSWTAQPYAFSTSTTSECASATTTAAKTIEVADTIDVYPVIEITARGGYVDTFTFTVNGDGLTYLGTIAQNNTVTISSLNYTLTAGANLDTELTGAFEAGTVFPADVSGVFPLLANGSNSWSIQYDGTATHVDVCFTWRRRYR